MSLSQRLNGSKSDGVSGMDAEKYEALIKQLKLLSKSQASLFKAYIHSKLHDVEKVINKAALYLNEVGGSDSQAKDLKAALAKVNLEELHVDVVATRIQLQDELSQLRAAIENNGSLPANAVTVEVVSSVPSPELEAKLNEQSETIKSLEADNQKLRDLLREAKNEITTQAAKPTGFADVDRLGKEVAKLKDSLSDAEVQLTTKDSQISSLRTEVESQKRIVSLEQAEKTKLQAEISALQAKHAALEIEIAQEKSSSESAVANKIKAVNDAAERKLRETVEHYEQEKKELEDAMAAEIEEIEKSKEDEKAKFNSEIEKRDRQLSSMKKANSALSRNLQKIHRNMDDISGTLQSLRTDSRRELIDFGKAIRVEYSALISSRLRAVAEENRSIQAKYVREMTERKKLHNIIQELKGNIRVFMRCRPPTNREIEQFGNDAQCVSFLGPGEVRVVNEKNREKTWEFDEVFDWNTSQEQVYADVSQLVTSVLDGFNVCIFAYGQTGSGKTFTMMGPSDNRGVNTRALEELFQKTNARAGEWTDTITVSILEVYNEEIRDLLADHRSDDKLQVKIGEFGNFVPGLSQVPVNDNEQVLRLIATADRNRASAVTNMNEHSSRSHMMLTVNLVSEFHPTGVLYRGKLNLVDLAGSERLDKSGAVGQALKEAQNINKSLSALGDVIAARAQKQAHIPFRNSTLTYLLQDSLSQDSKTLMIVCASPILYNAEETFCSLNFASRVRTVELGKASKQTMSSKAGTSSASANNLAAGRRTSSATSMR
jgi:kinesin family protein C2/C3